MLTVQVDCPFKFTENGDLECEIFRVQGLLARNLAQTIEFKE